MNLADIRHLFDYTEWANDLALNAAANLSDENLRRDFGISHKSIFGTLVHMAGAEWIWWERWNGRSPAKADAWSLWSTDACADLPTLNERWGELVDGRARFMSELIRSDSMLSCRSSCSAATRTPCGSFIRCNTWSITRPCIADKSSA